MVTWFSSMTVPSVTPVGASRTLHPRSSQTVFPCYRCSLPRLLARTLLLHSSLLPPILRLRRLLRLPLHIARSVCPTPLERHNVVDHVAGTGDRGLHRRGAEMV